jgi:hypothetical protein
LEFFAQDDMDELWEMIVPPEIPIFGCVTCGPIFVGLLAVV